MNRQTLLVFLFLTVSSAVVFVFAAVGPTIAAEPLAVVNGVPITAEEIEKPLAPQISKLEEQLYDLKRQKIDALINEKLLADEAKKRGISVPALLDTEVTSKVGLVTEQEIEDFYQAHKAQIKPGEEAQAREQIRTYLQNQKLAQQREAFIQSLRSHAKIVVNLKPPPILRVDVPIIGAPFKGPAKAPVTIVEFTDFHCPFCKSVVPTLAQLVSRYGDKVKLVFKDFPIEQLHPGATKAHEAARCANEQGKFWPYYDKLFDNATKTSPEELKAYAGDVGLDVPAFEKCYSSEKYRAAVQKDIEEGRSLGVTGTPTFFIDGRMLLGNQPLDAFARIIDDELTRTNKNQQSALSK
jgi:protein-disulfide isomerase